MTKYWVDMVHVPIAATLFGCEGARSHVHVNRARKACEISGEIPSVFPFRFFCISSFISFAFAKELFILSVSSSEWLVYEPAAPNM